MKNITYYLYWYHLDTDTNPYIEGYIGITNDLNRRHKEHKYSSNKQNSTYINSAFTRAINKHNGIDSLTKTVLHSGGYEEICALERKYRPFLHIGWNIAVGGEHPGIENVFKGVNNRWSKSQKEAIGKAHKGKTLPREQIDNLINTHRETHPSCKEIALFHKDNYPVLYTYHSIGEASRQLDIPRSRLKYKVTTKVTSYGEDGWAVLFDRDYDRSNTPTGRELSGKVQKGKPKPSIQGKNHWKNKQTSVSSNEAD